MVKVIKLPFGMSIALIVRKWSTFKWFNISPNYFKNVVERNDHKYYYRVANIDLTIFGYHIMLSINRMNVIATKEVFRSNNVL